MSINGYLLVWRKGDTPRDCHSLHEESRKSKRAFVADRLRLQTGIFRTVVPPRGHMAISGTFLIVTTAVGG